MWVDYIIARDFSPLKKNTKDDESTIGATLKWKYWLNNANNKGKNINQFAYLDKTLNVKGLVSTPDHRIMDSFFTDFLISVKESNRRQAIAVKLILN